MDIEKLIERLRKEAYGSDIEELLLEAATAIETLRAENVKLQYEEERQRRSADDMRHLYENAERAYTKVQADLARVTAERDAAQALLAERSGVIGSAPITTAFGIPLDRLKELVEVRHGRWLTTDAYPHHLYCSVCYKTYAKNAKWVNELDLPTNYCPNCGALMDGKEDEDGQDPIN